MGRTLCQREHMLRDDFEAYCQLVAAPRHVCRSCGRAAHKKKHLCDPRRIRVDNEADTA